jgi:hypothetical protein
VECLSTIFASYAALHSLLLFGVLLDVEFLWAFRAMAPLAGLSTCSFNCELQFSSSNYGAVALMVHLFFCRRIWIFGKSIILPIFILLVRLPGSFEDVTIFNRDGRFLLLSARWYQFRGCWQVSLPYNKLIGK